MLGTVPTSREKNILRELNKAYVGFSNRDCEKLCAVATGTVRYGIGPGADPD